MAIKDVTGVRHGSLVAVKPVSRTGSESYRWLWTCDCGGTKVLHTHSAKATGHCGCRTHENLVAGNTKHGAAATTVYKAWAAMKDRCLNPNNEHYVDYGGRGIAVCERWSLSFQNFIDDMGARPAGMTIERINNSGNYEPGNCRWATRKEQQRNRRTNIYYEIGGVSKCLMEWCEFYKIRYQTVRRRLSAGWTVERALSGSVDLRYRNKMAKEYGNGVVQ